MRTVSTEKLNMSDENTLNNLLKIIAKEQNYNNYDIIIKEISSDGANFSSKLYKVTIKEINKSNLNLFAKVACGNEAFRKVTDNGKMYSTERYVYTELVEIFKRLEDKVDNEIDRIIPKYYGHDATEYNETIVLEDLSATGWNDFDRFKSIDWPYASTAFTELAKLHALSFAFKNKNSNEYNSFLKCIKLNVNGQMLDTMLQNCLTSALKHVDLEYQDGLKKHVNEYKLVSPKFLGGNNETVIIHGDYRPSNLMHKVKHDGTVDIKIVDLQTMQGNSPVVDLFYFIFTGSDEEFRSKYYEKLLDHYYTELEAAMKRLHLDPEKIYSREDFEFDLKEKLPYGLSLALLVIPIVTVEAKNAYKSEPNENMEMTNFTEDTNQLYAQRIKGLVNDFVKWGYIK